MKLKRQMKSRIYYMFWGAMTITVFIGQLYVGTGYRLMTDSVNRLLLLMVYFLTKIKYIQITKDLFN